MQEHELNRQVDRWLKLIERHCRRFGESEVRLFSTPGRSEIGGNHTDHNHGKVLAAAINLDSIAVVTPIATGTITLSSEGFDQLFIVDSHDCAPRPGEKGTTNGLIRGIVSRFQQLGLLTGGFNASITSDVLIGSGLSSSASIEVLIGTILNSLYNHNLIDPVQLAIIGQYAENQYFGKPCGLMDQITCAVGGIVIIDFHNPTTPGVEKLNLDLSRLNMSLVVVDTGGNHADLTEDYASIPHEMKSVAALLGKNVCREVSLDDLMECAPRIREELGDRAFLRAFHFLKENTRVDRQVEALKKEDIAEFLRLVTESGNSSFRWLQNIFTTKNVKEQGVAVALALTEHYLKDIPQGACRVHGGGFAGTIQVFLPNEAVQQYRELIESILPKGCVRELSLRSQGTIQL